MNVAITRAAEGFPRRAFTVDDISRMIEAGVLGEDENFELIEGDLVVMAAKHVGHDGIKNALNMALARSAPDGAFVAIECTLQLAMDILVEPDIAIVSRAVYAAARKSFARPRPQDVPLLIEIAASSLAYDRGVKARLYARHGIREFWVIDADARITWVHTGPSGDTWSSIVERGPHDALTTPAVPGFSIRLADIGR
jgi:Uma2 family endonuclease